MARFHISRPVAAAIFDFDETLIDLEAQHHAAYSALCVSEGSDYHSIPPEIRNASGRRVLDEVAEMRSFFGWSRTMDELMRVRQRAFDEICAGNDLTLLPGAERVVRTLHSRGIKLAIATSSVRQSIEIVLHRFGLTELFATIVDGAQVTHAKPDPEAYLITAASLAVEGERCVVFEDSTPGVGAAKNAGMFCVAVRNPLAPIRQELGAADVIIDSFDELSDEELRTW